MEVTEEGDPFLALCNDVTRPKISIEKSHGVPIASQLAWITTQDARADGFVSIHLLTNDGAGVANSSSQILVIGAIEPRDGR